VRGRKWNRGRAKLDAASRFEQAQGFIVFPCAHGDQSEGDGFRTRFSTVSLGYCLERTSMACAARAASPQLAKAAVTGERFAPVGDCWREAEARDFAEEQSPIRLEVKGEAPPRIAANSVFPNLCAEACASRMVSEEAWCFAEIELHEGFAEKNEVFLRTPLHRSHVAVDLGGIAPYEVVPRDLALSGASRPRCGCGFA